MQTTNENNSTALAQRAKGILESHYQVQFLAPEQYVNMTPEQLTAQIDKLNHVKSRINEDHIRTSERLKTQETQLVEMKQKAMQEHGADTPEGLSILADALGKEIQSLLDAHLSPEEAVQSEPQADSNPFNAN